MQVKGDTTGIDSLSDAYDDAYFQMLSEIGREATRNARVNGNYQNRTGNLRNANGGCVVRGGKIVDIWVDSDGMHPDAVKATENLLIYSRKEKDGLYLSNGMDYASFVESRNYEVILTHGLLYAERQIKKRI